MRVVKNSLTTLFIISISIAMLEFLSFVAVKMMSSDPVNEHLRHHVARFHPLFNKFNSESGNPIPLYQRTDEKNPFVFDPRLGYANKPNAIYSEKLLIGPDGFICNAKCTPLPRNKPDNEARVFLFGGSSVAGHGNIGRETISAFLEEVLRERKFFTSKNVRVINAGIGSAFSTQQLTLLTTKVSLYEPDWVIFFDGNNDQGRWHYDNFYPFAPSDLRPNYHSYDYTLIRGLRRVQDPIGAVFHSVNLWNQHFPLLHYSAVLAKHLRTTRSAPPLAINPAAAVATKPTQDDFKLRLYRRKTNSVYNYILNLKMALGAANAIGAKGIACLQPGLPYLRPDGSPRKSRLVGPEQEASTVKSAGYTAWYNAATTEFAALQKENTPARRFCNMTNLFDDETEQIYLDKIHYNARGNQMIAKELANQMRLMGAQE